MNNSGLSKTKVFVYLGLALISFSIVYTSTLNPFNSRIMNIDTSVYISVTQGITRGQILYKDLTDNKGPLLYFMSVPGFYFGGLTGIWITELIVIFISLLFMYKTALLFVNTKIAFLTMFFTSLALLPFFYVNAGTEEYSLPFLAISLYIFTKHYVTSKKINLLEILILGICFSCSIMIRLNMFPLWAGFCLIISIESIVKRRFIDLAKYILVFILGICVTFFPIYLYFRHNNIFADFYHHVISAGISRGFRLTLLKDFSNNFYHVINRSYSFIPLCIGIIWFFIRYKSINAYYFAAYTFSYFLCVVFLSFAKGNSHYNLVLIPFFVPAIAFLSDSFLHLFSKLKHKYLALIFLFCVAFSEGIVRLSYYFIFNFDSSTPLKTAGKIIDTHTEPEDKIINLGSNGYIYPYTKRGYASKYIFQGESFDHIPGAREEFISSIKNTRPKIMTIITEEYVGSYQFKPGWHEYAYDLLQTDYRLISDLDAIKIFLRND